MKISKTDIEIEVVVKEKGYNIVLTEEEARIVALALGMANFDRMEESYKNTFNVDLDKTSDKTYRLYNDLYEAVLPRGRGW